MTPTRPPAPSDSTWAPLRSPIFRVLFLAQLGSNIGNWMETVAAQWLLVGDPHASALVSLVQTADMLPFMFLALPAGVMADVFDRRRYLVLVHLFLTATAGITAALTLAGMMRPPLLLALTFVGGAGSALAIPAWQAIVPELVPRRQLAAAAALGGINQNVARAVGPALAGVLVSRIGPGAVFAINAVTFVFGILVMLVWRPSPIVADRLGRERILPALRAGTRYVRNAPIVRRLLLRVTLFVAPAAALWGLLPVVASDLLRLGPSGYGVLLGSLGIGAIAGAVALPRLRKAVSNDWLVVGASTAYAAALAVAALVGSVAVVMLGLVVAGVAWITVIVSVNSGMQLVLPSWVRARGLAMYQLTFMGTQAIAAACWGVIADHFGISAALVAAAVVLVLSGATVLWWRILEVDAYDPTSAVYWPMPALLLDPAPMDGPVLVTIRYAVPEANSLEFARAMERVGRSRRGTGAVSWELYRDGVDLRKFVEIFTVPTWEEHLRQHDGRLTASDRHAEEHVRRLLEEPPIVEHLFPSDPRSMAPRRRREPQPFRRTT